ncbi:hypothetical protein CPB86DRAFT_353510 [Serendipita vermifera]|nr:hypothetical protein CPB86DRAFT_353510 [Serendipita vermifera]
MDSVKSTSQSPELELSSYYMYEGRLAHCLLCNSKFEKRNKKRHERTALHTGQLRFYNLPLPNPADDPNVSSAQDLTNADWNSFSC